MKDPTLIINQNPETIDAGKIIGNQRSFFNTQETKSYKFRLRQLKNLRTAFKAYEKKLLNALYADLHKSEMEAFTTEVGLIQAEIKYAIKHLKGWMKPEYVNTPLLFFPANSQIRYEPYGVALIISPWNYPVKNSFGPVLGAMCAGNCIILKPSELSPNTSNVIAEMVTSYFDPAYFSVVQGGVETATALLKEKTDYILFTGSTRNGKIIYEAAAKHLTPVTLELGGKSPAIVDKNINLDITAKRLVWGKFMNAGQTCISPDYVFVHEEIKEALIKRIKEIILEFYGENPEESQDFGRIINQAHFNRICGLIEGNVVFGGNSNAEKRFIEPTIIEDVTYESKVMQEEIFGPVMPIITFKDTDEVIRFINSRAKSLSLYVFSKNKKFRQTIIENTSSGGVCENDALWQNGQIGLPFGGVGDSGMGSYNGIHGFKTFSHKRAILKRYFILDFKQKYAPFTGSKYKFLRLMIDKFFS
jgi:aldehyde dehydrogenase (NAD+)